MQTRKNKSRVLLHTCLFVGLAAAPAPCNCRDGVAVARYGLRTLFLGKLKKFAEIGPSFGNSPGTTAAAAARFFALLSALLDSVSIRHEGVPLRFQESG
jgi:hypothetical protein